MAETATHFDLSIFIDKGKGKVLFAEADGHFVDVLFSFLTLPLGTILRLIAKTRSKPAATLGCFSSLYQSVTSLGNEHFREKEFKDMLLHLLSPYGDIHQRLKINIDDAETKYYLCKYNTCSACRYLMSIYEDSSCGVCGRSMALVEKSEASEYSSKGKVFFSKASKFIITDDLQVTLVVPGTFMDHLKNLGTIDLGMIEERTVQLGLSELIELLKTILLSTTPLTDLFGSKTKKPVLEPVIIPTLQTHSGEGRNINVKVVLNKSSKELIFVESGGDFIDFLFSLLLVPLGEMLHILEGQSGLGCIDGLYKSVQTLDSKHFRSEHEKNILLRPKLSPCFTYKDNLFPLESTPIRCCVEGMVRKMNSSWMRELDSGGFVREEGVFIVLDNLTVKPFSEFSAAAAISILNMHKISVSDLGERTLSIGMAEAVSILRASLNSTSAISKGCFVLNGHDPQPELIPDFQSSLSLVYVSSSPLLSQHQVCHPGQKATKLKEKRPVPEENPEILQAVEYAHAKKDVLNVEYRNTLAVKLWELEEKDISSMSPVEFEVWQERRAYLKNKLDEANMKLHNTVGYHNSASIPPASKLRKI